MNKFISRKFLVTLLTPGFVMFMQSHGVPEDTIHYVVGLLGAYVIGQSVADFGAAKAPISNFFKGTTTATK